MKLGKHQRSKQRWQELCWKVHNHAQSFVLCSYTMHKLRNQHVSIGWFSLGGRVLDKVLYGEALPRGPTPYSLIYHFGRKGTPFICLLLKKGTLSHT